jgi:16S rRNA (cytosine1402-N4)-methyltransferase
MTGSDSGPAVAGGPARHIPVLSRQVLDWLAPRDGGTYVDGTFGAGGHSAAILAAGRCRVVGIDRDQAAIAGAADLLAAAQGRLTLVHDRFSRLDAILAGLGLNAADGILLDLGVSSMQLDQADRGFSFRMEGPLDMRMGGAGPSAADVVATASERDLSAIIHLLGEERHARAVARTIVAAREQAPIRSTTELAQIVGRVVRGRPGDIHPATRTFQALRIFVNDELGEIAAGLAAAERALAPQGRLVAISFHSLEDRIVKSFLVARSRVARGSRHAPEAFGPDPSFRLLTRKPVVAGPDEIAANPRARSAKLRAAERTSANAAPAGDLAELLPRLPTLADVMKGR